MLGGVLGLVGLSTVAAVLITATVTPAIALSGAAASSAITMFDNLPSVLDIDKLMLPSTIYYKNPDTGADQVLTEFYDQDRQPVKSDEVAVVMKDAILSSEDPRFYQHGGVDLIGTSRAILSNLSGSGETQGGSSISQQYVKNVLIQRCERDAVATEELSEAQVLANCWTDATNASGAEGYQRKLQEMRYAIALEQKYSKNDILIGYLNIANFGGRTYGIEAAAKRYFGVSSKDLTVAQAATLAGIVQNPNTYKIDDATSESNGAPNGVVEASATQLYALGNLVADGTITQDQYNAAADGYGQTKVRQLYVLTRMLDDGKITRDQFVAAAVEPITPNITARSTGCAAAGAYAYFCQYVKNIVQTDTAFGATSEDREKTLKRGGLSIYTTLDPRVQNAANQAMAENAPTSLEGMVDASTGKFGAAAVSVENDTGRILSIAQNTIFSEDADVSADPNYSSLVYAGDQKYGNSGGFPVGSTFKLFTLVDWLEKGHSLNETLNGRYRTIKSVKNSCGGDWYPTNGEKTPSNFGGSGGYVGTPMQFTRDSLNTGYFAMAEQLDLCDIKNVATKMGVTLGSGEPVTMNTLFSIIGSNNVSPLALAGAYGTVANNGIYCQPKAIDRVTDSDGNEIAPPQTTCTQVLDPKVAAAAASALEGVMNGGTGTASNPYDGTPVLGKTGTHESFQTWMVESSTKVATAVWVGNSIGEGDIFNRYFNGTQMSQTRHRIAPVIQGAADSVYGGNDFPAVDSAFTQRKLTDLPNVVGLSIDDATSKLRDAGFDVNVGTAVDSTAAAGIVAAQDPGAGGVAGGTTVTISPSNGQGTTVPDVTGQGVNDALSAIRGAGFGNAQPGTCTVDPAATGQGKVTSTSPAAGTVSNRNTAVSVAYSRDKCP